MPRIAEIKEDVDSALGDLKQANDLYKAIKDDESLQSTTFPKAGSYTTLAHELVYSVKLRLKESTTNTDAEALEQRAGTIKKRSRTLKTVIADLQNSKTREQAYNALSKEDKVELLLKELLEAVALLVKAKILQLKAEQAKSLVSAINVLKKLANPSSSDAKIAYSGIGDLFVNTGTGEIYTAKDHGTIQKAENIYINSGKPGGV